MKALLIIKKVFLFCLFLGSLNRLVFLSSLKMTRDCLVGDVKDQVIYYPFEVRGEWPLFVLAQAITLIPGKVTVDQQGGHLLVHLVRGLEAEATIKEIKTKLEEPIARIFA
ncbi:MAG: Na+/H+ antiporter subunit E [SAR324 cluster bacterium]|nr:Na+/H+ antiporter subunit E [SAR324 cluster bacterium]